MFLQMQGAWVHWVITSVTFVLNFLVFISVVVCCLFITNCYVSVNHHAVLNIQICILFSC